MNRRIKLFFSLVSLCFSIAILCFGVYSAMSISYSISGSVSYEVTDAFVDIETTLYLSTSDSTFDEQTLDVATRQFEDALLYGDMGGFEKHNTYKDTYSSFSSSGIDLIGKHTSKNIPLNYGAYKKDERAYAYFIAVKITNNGGNIISANLDLGDISQLNSYVTSDKYSFELKGKSGEKISTKYFIIGMAIKDATISIDNEKFSYSINITPNPLETPVISICQEGKNVDLQNIFVSNVDITQDVFTDKIDSNNQRLFEDYNLYISMSNVELQNTNDLQNIDYLNIKIVPDRSILGIFVLNGKIDLQNATQVCLEYILNDIPSDLILDECFDDSFSTTIDSYTAKLNDLQDMDNYTILVASMTDYIDSISYRDCVGYSSEGNSWQPIYTIDDVKDTLSIDLSVLNFEMIETSIMQTIPVTLAVQDFRVDNIPYDYKYMHIDFGDTVSWLPFLYILEGEYITEEIITMFSTEETLEETINKNLVTTGIIELPHNQQQSFNFYVIFIKEFNGENSETQISVDLSFLHYEGLFDYTLNLDNSYTIKMKSFVEFIGVDSWENYNMLPDIKNIIVPRYHNGIKITALDTSCFENSTAQTIFIPNTIKDIGMSAFASCSNLQKVYLFSDNWVYDWMNIDFDCGVSTDNYNLSDYYEYYSTLSNPFNLNSNLNLYVNGEHLSHIDLVIPDGVTEIKDNTFSGMSIKSVELPSSIKTVGYGAFNCDSIESVYIFDLSAFSGIDFQETTIMLGSAGDQYGNYQDYNSFDIKNSNPLENGADLYVNNVKVENILILPAGTKTISSNSLKYLKSVTAIVFPDTLKSIEQGAFNNMNIERVDISSLQSWLNIEFGYTWQGWIDSNSNGIIDLNENVPSLYVGSNPLENGAKLYISEQLVTDVIVPENITKINDFAFRGYKFLQSVTIGDNLIEIGTEAFYNSTINKLIIDDTRGWSYTTTCYQDYMEEIYYDEYGNEQTNIVQLDHYELVSTTHESEIDVSLLDMSYTNWSKI